jgi:hypothetical protein
MEPKIKGLAKGLIEEVIKADMSMHVRQTEAWAWMAAQRPRGAHIPPDIFKGFPESRYLSLNEVTFKMHLKPVPVHSFWQRLKAGMNLIMGRSTLRTGQGYLFDFCSSGEESAQAMQITIKRLKDGKIKADYGPADIQTSEIMNL